MGHPGILNTSVIATKQLTYRRSTYRYQTGYRATEQLT